MQILTAAALRFRRSRQLCSSLASPLSAVAAAWRAACERWGDALGSRVYTSRLVGADPALVLHGGGNTSVKVRETNLFGDEEEIIYVKGDSGYTSTSGNLTGCIRGALGTTAADIATAPAGSYADTDELVALCRTVAECGGVYVTHVRYDLGDGAQFDLVDDGGRPDEVTQRDGRGSSCE